MEPIFFIILLSIFLGVTATAQESLLEKKEKIKHEKLLNRQKYIEQGEQQKQNHLKNVEQKLLDKQKHAEEQEKQRKIRIEAIEERKRKTLLERAKKV